tara:strand:- start:275 stop:649 length:375 start_codon:yes stop_codon:yes gene_type:complete
MKKNTTVRVDEDTIKYYADNYKTSHAGACIALEGYRHLREESLRSMNDILTIEELKFLLSATKQGKFVAKDMASRRKWEAEIADFAEENNTGKSEVKELVLKLRTISPLDRYVIRENLHQTKNQ